MKIKDAVKRTIASNIRLARINAGMTQAAAAERLGLTAQAVSNFERGINNIENSMLVRMCEIYGTSMSAILGEENLDQPELTEEDRELYKLLKQIPEDQKKLFLEMGRLFVNNLNKDR